MRPFLTRNLSRSRALAAIFLACLVALGPALFAHGERGFAEQAGLSADLANDGEEAVRAYAQGAYDVVLMDIHMPKVDGVEAARRIRALQKERNAPPIRLIALTADALTHQVSTYLEGDFDDHISKPIRAEELFAALGVS